MLFLTGVDTSSLWLPFFGVSRSSTCSGESCFCTTDLRLDAFERDLMSESFVAYCCQCNTGSHSSTCTNITHLFLRFLTVRSGLQLMLYISSYNSFTYSHLCRKCNDKKWLILWHNLGHTVSGRRMIDALERIWKEPVVVWSRYYPDIYIWKQTMKNLNQDSQCHGQDSNQALLKDKSKVVLLHEPVWFPRNLNEWFLWGGKNMVGQGKHICLVYLWLHSV